MLKRNLIALLGLVTLLATGCSTTQKYMAGGAAIGATAGGIWANEAGLLSAAEGALVGGAAGATIGALIGDQVADRGGDTSDRDALARQLADAQAENDRLRKELEDCLKNKPAVQTETKTEYLSLSILSDVLFQPGKAVLREEGKQELNRLAEQLNSTYLSQQVMIEGHTDTQPIVHSGWKDNWELGAARSLAVLRYLAARGVDEQRMAASTYSFYAPVATNDTAEGRKENRRSEIAIHTGIKRTNAK